MLEATTLEVRLRPRKELTEFRDRSSENNGIAPLFSLNDRPGRNEVLHSHRLERVVRTMSRQLEIPMTNEHLANVACLSPFHFNRVFRDVTGIPPIQFHYALRLDRAKRLLIDTDLSITDICFEVGYNSLGTFVSRFKELVGLPPSAFRRFGRQLGAARLTDFRAFLEVPQSRAIGNEIRVTIANTPRDFDGLIFTAFFQRAIAEGIPAAYAMINGSGSSYMRKPSDGEWHVLSVAIPWQSTGTHLLTLDGLARGHSGPIRVQGGCWSGANTVALIPPRLLDPPFLVALPVLVSHVLRTEPQCQAGRALKAAAMSC